MLAIDVVNVKKTYKNGVQALDGINLSVKASEIFSLLGQNGAGKSTLIGILTTYLKADTGEITVLGNNIVNSTMKVRNNIACVAQRISIDKHLSLRENMMFQADLYRIPKDELRKEWKY
ncbi:ATP-binding cassette domain-containing protein [Peptoniphilus sp.]|uniref:ATP-binding cassette domain-containing protein n=1 Tax=Peptoniphilus sp. TaxID=1971214 RepID=UPI002A820502|nr:ATP-binding cassette domain-containing protein [Peptoniphilus sp.]MDY3902543.1 ATP-binding cassette domain-containing protein [Peptoniphilus sp.]